LHNFIYLYLQLAFIFLAFPPFGIIFSNAFKCSSSAFVSRLIFFRILTSYFILLTSVSVLFLYFFVELRSVFLAILLTLCASSSIPFLLFTSRQLLSLKLIKRLSIKFRCSQNSFAFFINQLRRQLKAN